MGFFDKINYSMIVNAFKTAVYKGKGQTFISLAINVSATMMRNIHWLCLNYLTISSHLKMFFCNRVSFQHCHNIKYSLQVQHLHRVKINFMWSFHAPKTIVSRQQCIKNNSLYAAKPCQQSNMFLIFSECPVGSLSIKKYHC